MASVAGAYLLLLSRHGVSQLRELWTGPVDWREVAVLVSTLPVGVGAYLYYSNAEMLLSLHSYLIAGKIGCFPMQLFSLVEALNPAGDTTLIRKINSRTICRLNSRSLSKAFSIFPRLLRVGRGA